MTLVIFRVGLNGSASRPPTVAKTVRSEPEDLGFSYGELSAVRFRQQTTQRRPNPRILLLRAMMI